MVRNSSIIAVPPGETIKEQLSDKGLGRKEFAMKMSLPQSCIDRLLDGEEELTMDIAFRLEMVLGIPAKFWNNLETNYRKKLKNIMETDL